MCLGALRCVQLHRDARQTAIGPPCNRDHYFQIPTQFHHRRRGRIRCMLPLRLQKQLRLIQQPLANRRGGRAPGGIQLSRFTAAQAMPRKSLRHAPAVFRTAPRHRHQELHRHMRRDRAAAHLLLHALRKQLDQSHPPRHPTRAAIKTAGQLLQSIAEALLQLHQQPALFQRRLVIATAHGTIQKQGLRFAQRPDHRLDRVPTQLSERRHPLVAVDDQVMLRLLGDDHHDRRLLAAGSQRCQQAPMTFRPMHPKVLQTPLKLVKFQPHPSPSLRHSNLTSCHLGLHGEIEKCRRICPRISSIDREVGLRGVKQ